MPLVYLPEPRVFFLWGEDVELRTLPDLIHQGALLDTELIVPSGRARVEGIRLPLLPATATLASLPAASAQTLAPSVATWMLASKVAIELVARERVVPSIVRRERRVEARWAVALAAGDDAAKVLALARSMPPAAHAVPAAEQGTEVWAPEALLRAYLDAVADALVRSAVADAPSQDLKADRAAMRRVPVGARAQWSARWQNALQSGQSAFDERGFGERALIENLERWSEPAIGARDKLRACFRLELPGERSDAFVLRFLLQSPDDPSLLVSAIDVWKTKGNKLQKLGRAFREPQESLLEALGRASRLFAPIEGALENARPESIELDPSTAWAFLSEGAPALTDAGFGVIVPSELTAAGQRRLRLRMRIGTKSKTAGTVKGASGLGLDELLEFSWEAVVGDESISVRELAALAKYKAPLVRHRGAWVAVDPNDLAEIQKRIAEGGGRVSMRDAVQGALAGASQAGSLSAVVAASGSFATTLERLQRGAETTVPVPSTLRATLRPYQERGLAWLSTMASLGFGACLADDMGLGKTVQILAYLLRRAELASDDTRSVLLVAPTSVLGNWEREVERFTPTLSIIRHYGATRSRTVDELGAAGRDVEARRRNASVSPGPALVLTTYGLLRRDAEILSKIDWSVVVLDEAQNIKNAASATARFARSLRASHRFALTGTPVENRLAELWSIFEFANPGLLGPLEKFRRHFAIPIERYSNEDAADKLRRLVGPFLLRRVKSDPAIIQDLPPKNEMKVVCTLTREQATLYKAVVDEEMRRIQAADGMERRGRVLALLTFLKQICNHPAQYLSERGPLANRSGKLARLVEMLEEALATGDKALVFTQFREMGDRLVEHLQRSFATEVLFLHGGTTKRGRDDMVQRFQSDDRGPRIFVLSLKAGGTGLNLTAANHVFHYDRWWNPAVEDQATDRAYRIGQRRAVQVHKLLCAGTVEEKVDRLLEQKRGLSSKIVGSGENWITELDDAALRDLFGLSSDAAIGDDADDDGAPREPARRRKAEVRA